LPNSMCAGALLRMRRINRSASVVGPYSVGTAIELSIYVLWRGLIPSRASCRRVPLVT
jgi:hypothetical protein